MTTDIYKCASELYQCSVWFSLNALNFTKAARAGPDLALSCPECLTVKSVPQLHFFPSKNVWKRLWRRELCVPCCDQWGKSMSSHYRDLCHLQQVVNKKKPLLGSALGLWPVTKKMKCVLSKLQMHTHMQICLHMHATHPHAYPSQIHYICSRGVSDRGEYNDR